jgi:hypothetical protein
MQVSKGGNLARGAKVFGEFFFFFFWLGVWGVSKVRCAGQPTHQAGGDDMQPWEDGCLLAGVRHCSPTQSVLHGGDDSISSSTKFNPVLVVIYYSRGLASSHVSVHL